MNADAGGREVLSADFADDADEEKEICAIGVICSSPQNRGKDNLLMTKRNS
jgi:hypothetical protein